MSSELARTFIRRRRSLMFLEAWLMVCERPLHRTRYAHISAALSRSLSGIRPPLSPPGWSRRGFLPDRAPLAMPSTIQAALGDDVVLVPSGVPRALVPL